MTKSLPNALCHLEGTATKNADKITFNLQLEALNSNFKHVSHKVIKVMGYYGVAVRYENSECEDDYGTDEISKIEFEINKNEILDWDEMIKIRVMTLNECTPEEFEKLFPYFNERLAYHKYEAITQAELNIYNKDWNRRNRADMQVGAYTKHEIDKKPRIAKGDIILGLTAKP